MKKQQTGTGKPENFIAEVRREKARILNDYREKALRMYPAVCARCGREFEGKRIRELTVHHRDHNHDNNPPDGTNWELLCLYCHDNEHSRYLDSEWHAITTGGPGSNSLSGNKPLAGLEALLKEKNPEDNK